MAERSFTHPIDRGLWSKIPFSANSVIVYSRPMWFNRMAHSSLRRRAQARISSGNEGGLGCGRAAKEHLGDEFHRGVRRDLKRRAQAVINSLAAFAFIPAHLNVALRQNFRLYPRHSPR